MIKISTKILIIVLIILPIFSIAPIQTIQVQAQSLDLNPCNYYVTRYLEPTSRFCMTTGLLGSVAGDVWSQAMISAFSILLSEVGNLILHVVSWITWLAGVMLNTAILMSVFEMRSYVDNMPAIRNGWTIFRDIANIGFIFIILYVAIATILQLGIDTRKTIIKLIIAALLINFSLFFTKIIIDGSNILTVSLFNQIGEGVVNTGITGANFLDNGLSGRMVQALGLQEIYTTDNTDVSAAAFANLIDFTIRVIGGSIFLLFASIILFAAAIMFMVRFVILIFLMITAPIAFIAMILPQTNSISRRWWKSLTSQAIFAPVFMLMLLITLNLIGSLRNTVNSNVGLGDALSSSQSAAGATFLTFVISIAFLVGTLVISKMTGGVGGDWATKVGGRAVFGGAAIGGRFAGRQIGGRLADSRMVQNALESDSKIMKTAGRLGLAAGERIKSGTYDYSNAAGKAASGLSQSLGGGKVDLGKSVTRKDLDKKEKEKIERRMKRMEPSTYQISQAEQAKKEAEDVEKLAYDRVKERVEIKDIDTEIRTHSDKASKGEKEAAELESSLKKHEEELKTTTDSYEKTDLEREIILERSALQNKKSSIDSAKKEQELAEKRKRDLIETEMASFRKQREEASKALDKLKGVDEDEAKKRAGGKLKGESDYEYNQRVEGKKVKGVGEIRKESYVKDHENNWFGTKRGNAERAKIARDAMKGKKKIDKKALEDLGIILDDEAGKTGTSDADKSDKDDTKTT